MTALLSRVLDAFGADALTHSVFYYAREPALRFELGGEGLVLDRFTQAYDRARAIAALAFKGSSTIVVIPGCYEVGNEGRKAALRSARACGVALPASLETLTLPAEHGLNRTLVAFENGVEATPRLLWGALAAEMGIRPRLRGDVYLADLSEGILLHPYDDRGLDIVGSKRTQLLPLYTAFGGWLLDHDRPQMDSMFLEP
ncbi:DUF3885 domain-containing protein [Deinococcus sp.]|uniref:DUF3885 domain-containing protein n=1 Tax=Deinococcus sp. TaxID=47478 RepID=UPI002869AE4E|nr:DUF3885 domain-containing protein [Deinococcus sp.]